MSLQKEIEAEIFSIIKKHGGEDFELDKGKSLHELDLDSVALLGMAVDIENRYKIDLLDNFRESFESIEDLALYIVEKKRESLENHQ